MIQNYYLDITDFKYNNSQIILQGENAFYRLISEDTKNAIYKFLLEYRDSSETLKLYIKELERLILWGQINNNNLDILNITREHIVKYQQFLENPTPKDLWCGPKVPKLLNNNIINPKWKPFYKNLSSTSIKKASKIIDSFFNYLVQINLLPGNPLAINRRRNKTNATNKIVDRYLELDEINYLLEALSKYQEPSKDNLKILRAKYIILLLFYTGLRISEATKHTMGNFIQRENNWFLSIIGKGKKYREIPNG
jgi:site-specific recombinase XerD